jgi:hypothetical protein
MDEARGRDALGSLTDAGAEPSGIDNGIDDAAPVDLNRNRASSRPADSTKSAPRGALHPRASLAAPYVMVAAVGIVLSLLMLVLLTYQGCVPSENSSQWSDTTLERAKGYAQHIRADLQHVQNLKTNMEYLRRSKEDEESRLRQERPAGQLFTYQEEEVKKTSMHIEGLKRELLNLPSKKSPVETAPAVRNTTVLTCGNVTSKLRAAGDGVAYLTAPWCACRLVQPKSYPVQQHEVTQQAEGLPREG